MATFLAPNDDHFYQNDIFPLFNDMIAKKESFPQKIVDCGLTDSQAHTGNNLWL